MKLCLKILLISSFFNITFNAYSKAEKDVQVLRTQLNDYLIEFDKTSSSNSAWAIFQLIKDDIIDEKYFLPLIENNDFESLNSKLVCILNDVENDIGNHLLLNFINCIDDPNLYLVYLHYLYKSNSIGDKYNTIINKLKNYSLTNKQYYHYLFFKNKQHEEPYNLDPNKSDILDFYFFDNIYSGFYNFDINVPKNWTEYSFKSFELKTDAIAHYFSTINALYKVRDRFRIVDLAFQINNYYDFPISKTSLRILRYISFSSYFNGFYQLDIDVSRNLLIPLTMFFSYEEQLKAKIDFGVSLYSIGNLNESKSYLEYVYDNINQLSDYRYQSALFNNLGVVYFYTGYFENYIQLIIKALDFAESHNDKVSEIHYLNNLHIYHKKIQNWQTSFEYLEQVSRIAEEIGDNRRQAIVNQSYATFHRDFKHDYNVAVYYFKNAKELAIKAKDYRLITSIISEFSDTYLQINKYNEALSLNYELLNLAENRNDESVVLYSYAKIANIYFLNGENDLAAKYIEKLKQGDTSTVRFYFKSLINSVIAKNHFINNDNQKGFELLSTFADEVLFRVKNSSEIQSGYLMLESNNIILFNLLISKLIENNYYEEAFYWMDEIKNLSTATFYNNPALKSRILSESELVLDFALRNRIERLRSEIYEAESDRRVQLNNQLLEAISEQNVLRRKVLQNIDLESADLNRLRRQLGRSDLILYFTMLDNQLFAATITSGSIDIQHLKFSDEDLMRIETLIESLSTDRVPLFELEWVREQFLDKMNISERYTNYIVIPDGFLYQIPLEILPVGNVTSNYSYGETKFLIEHASVSYVNSLKDLERSIAQSPKRNQQIDFLGIGISDFENTESRILPGRSLPPLPLAEKEVSEIAKNMTRFNNNEYLLSADGTKNNFRNKAGNSRILHLASHSEVFDTDPLYSLIYLNSGLSDSGSSDSSENNGLIYAYELFEMDLSNDMVMINSCESGSGNYIQGSGIIGFSRAFNYAGVQSLIMNLWSVRDRSAYEMSISFYNYLNEGYGKQEAMRMAKIDYINNTNSNPSNWGSFVVYGNVDPVVRSQNPMIVGLILLLLGVISFFAAWMRYYRFPLHRL